MAALLIRRRRPIAEPAGDALTLEGTRGADRIVAALAELNRDPDLDLGFDVGLDAVNQLLVDAESPGTAVADLDLGRQFDLVVLGSHLVNRPEEAVRLALLDLARRHLAPGGNVLIEHHPIDWASTAADVPATPGGQLGMVDVRRDPPFVSAVSVYDIGGRVVRQPFTARVLSEAELRGACAAAGLVVRKRLGQTWLWASPAATPSV